MCSSAPIEPALRPSYNSIKNLFLAVTAIAFFPLNECLQSWCIACIYWRLTMSSSYLAIKELGVDNAASTYGFPAYMVVSTAPKNVEDIEDSTLWERFDNPQRHIQNIANYLQPASSEEGVSETAEVLIVIHGYNTSITGVEKWFKSICQHIQSHCVSRSRKFIFIGYRWPSEQIIPDDLAEQEPTLGKWGFLRRKWTLNKKALPVILGGAFRWGIAVLMISLVGILASLVALTLKASLGIILLIIFVTVIIITLVAILPVVTVLLLRLAGYFRDNYRANYFGTPDLVELIRQLDRVLIENTLNLASDASRADPNQQINDAKSQWDQHRIKLSFIGHSMGGFVVTNTVRILSDVFAPESIGTMDAVDTQKEPSGAIGNVFRLGRLVLVSPDIPAETIISGRANFLQSSLRRFEEAYLFSNEGDMALRLASTAANYFSYPAKTQDGGYRLGNVTVRSVRDHPKNLPDDSETPDDYGMIARLPNGLLVKLQGNLDNPDKQLCSLLGGQVASIQAGCLQSLQGQPLQCWQGRQYVSADASQLKCLQEGQVARVNGQFVSLQRQKIAPGSNFFEEVWQLLPLQEGQLCHVQNKQLFSFNPGQLIKLSDGQIARVQGHEIEILSGTQWIWIEATTQTGFPQHKKSASQSIQFPFKIQNQKLFALHKGELVEANDHLLKVQDTQFAKLQGNQFIRLALQNGQLMALENEPVIEPTIDIRQPHETVAISWRFPLDYLFIRAKTPLSRRQQQVALASTEQPIGECFTFFDCTDYKENLEETKGVLTHAKCRKALTNQDYFTLTLDYFGGEIDTHGGYFNDPLTKPTLPEATFTKMAIYGLACMGFEQFLFNLPHQAVFAPYQNLYERILTHLAEQYPEDRFPDYSANRRQRIALVQVLSRICQDKQIQALLSQRRFSKDIWVRS
jgi:pimeloyl-ACP methyl ester carboxylesterase